MDGLTNEQAEYMETVYDNFQIIDILAQKEIKTTKRFTQNMNELFIEMAEEVQDEEFISLLTDFKIDNEGKTIKSYRRSVFYDFLKRMQKYYSKEIIHYMRNLIDCSYNLAIASAVNDDEGSDISTKFKTITDSSTIKKLNPSHLSHLNISKQGNVKTQVTWNDVFEILIEVSNIEKEKKISRKDALKIYKNRQNISNVFKVGKYLIGNTLKTLIPGLDSMNVLLNVASDVGINAGTELIDEKFNMQSIKELVTDFKTTNKTNKIIDNVINSLNYYSCNFSKL
ncbi:MAG: hypothetical protein IJA53_04775 [Spirochaetaceae bacterium]|nr:hypothetical protein [Spirochaetaceae bacterium]